VKDHYLRIMLPCQIGGKVKCVRRVLREISGIQNLFKGG
jgi:hypothetical protein